MSVNQEIIAGEAIAVKLKEFLFKDLPWTPKIANQIGLKLATLKEIAKPYYPDKDIVQILHILAGYSQQDIAEAFDGNNAKEGKLCLNQPNAIGAHLERCMATM